MTLSSPWPSPRLPDAAPRGFLRALFDAAVGEAIPGPALAAFLRAPPVGRTVVLGAGKAGGSLAAVDAGRPADAPLSGLVVTRYAQGRPAYRAAAGRIGTVETAHPVPDAAGRLPSASPGPGDAHSMRPASSTATTHSTSSRRSATCSSPGRPSPRSTTSGRC